MQLEQVTDAFARAYGHPPTHVVRAPGRVNLIGEHTDYSNLPVLPIAIERATWLAVASTDRPFVLARTAAFDEPLTLQRAEPRGFGGWGRYLAGALREFADVAPPRGAEVFVDGDLLTGLIAIGTAAFLVTQHGNSKDGGFVPPTLTPTPLGRPPRNRNDTPTGSITPAATVTAAAETPGSPMAN